MMIGAGPLSDGRQISTLRPPIVAVSLRVAATTLPGANWIGATIATT
jgi:hypothetical protein